MPSMTIQNLTKEFGEVRAVNNVSLTVAEGEMLVLVGPSGCGKTTCLRCLAGLERPTGGRIQIGDTVVTAIEDGVFVPPERRHIGMVFQSYAIWPHMTVFDNVAYPLKAMRLAGDEIRPRVMETLRLVQLDGLAERYSSQISGGQQQRVALARSLVGEPSLLLFDEPLSNLDASLRLQMRVEIKELQNRLEFTAVYVTHDQTEAMAIADRIAIMESGVMRQVGSARQIYDDPANVFVAGFMGTTNLLNGTVKSVDGGGAVVDAGSGILVQSNDAKGAAQGDSVHISIRPESLTLHKAGLQVDGVNAWKATISLATFIGEQIIYRAEAGPYRFELHARPFEIYDVGDEVTVTADPRRCILLKE
jgi:iron(III) transport system ATP-binding protein